MYASEKNKNLVTEETISHRRKFVIQWIEVIQLTQFARKVLIYKIHSLCSYHFWIVINES